VQIRFRTGGLTSEEYVEQQYWRSATLDRCPLHPRGGCGLKRHGSYERKSTVGAMIPRWRCPRGRTTFSLLADCFAARLPSPLAEVERVVRVVEASRSVEDAADLLRPDAVTLTAAVRWVRRRLQGVRQFVQAIAGLMPTLFAAGPAKLETLAVPLFGEGARMLGVLAELRRIGDHYLDRLSAPVGFRPRLRPSSPQPHRQQHNMGPDPPAVPG